MTGPSCPHSGHVSIPRGLEDRRKKKKEKQLNCGSCSQTFSAICTLHSHLKGDSYHFDHVTKTAYPLSPCQKKQKRWSVKGEKEDSCSENDENVPTYFTESGQMIGKMKRYKRKHQTFKEVVKTEKKEKSEAGNFTVELNPDYNDEEVQADPSNVTFEIPDISKTPKGQDTEAKSVIFEKDIFGNLPTEMLEKVPIIKTEAIPDDFELMNEAGTQTKIHDDEGDEMEDDLYEEMGEEMGVDASVNEEKMEHSDEETVASETAEASTNIEVPQEHINMQMTINLHSLETNPDGSLKIVVAEEDAGIFRTPQGEEILKALKEQAAKGVVAKNTQVVYNYTVPVDSVKPQKEVFPSANIVKTPTGLKKKRQRKYTPKEPDVDDDVDYEMSVGADGIEAIVFMKQEEKVTTEEAINILSQCNEGMHEEKISKIQPLSAKGGDVYIVDLKALPDKRDVRHDKYVWVHCGKKSYPKQSPTITRAMYKIKLPNNSYSDGFQKTVYEPVNPEERYALVHYTGYESLYQPVPHGNRKYGNKAHHRTCPSVLEELRALSGKTELSPNMIHKQIQSAAPEPGLRNVRTPRDLRQVRNFVFKAKRNAKKQRVIVTAKADDDAVDYDDAVDDNDVDEELGTEPVDTP